MKNSTNTFSRRAGRMLVALLLSFLSTTLPAQSVWTGAVNSNWNNPANWTGGVPAAGKTVTIFTCTTCPVINTTDNQAAFVQVYAGGKLTIGASGGLAISNPGGPGLKTHATSQVNVNQGGNLTIQNFWGEGLAVGGTFQNGGTISINGGHTGIAVSAGASFTNNVNGTTTVTGYSLNYAMTSSGTVLNNGIFNLDDANNDGISQQTGTITNGVNGTLNITKTGVNGIFTKGTFNNNGVLNIDNGLNGIYAIYGTFNNNAGGKLTVTGSSFLNDGIYLDPATFKNSGELTIQNALSKGIEISSGSTFNNFSKMTLNVPAWAGIFNVGGSNFTNRPCAFIETNAPIVNYATFANKGILKSTSLNFSSIGVNDGAAIGLFNVASGNEMIGQPGSVWTGCAGSNWNLAGSWYPTGVPEGSGTAIVQNVANASGNAPVVNTAANIIQELRLDNGALLTIASGGSLGVGSSTGSPAPATVRTGGKLKVNAGGNFSAQDVRLYGTIENSGSFGLGCRIVGAGNMQIDGGTFNNLAGGNFSSSACSPQGVGALVSMTASGKFINSGMTLMQGMARCSLVMSTLTNNSGGHFLIPGDGAGAIVATNSSTVNNLGGMGAGRISLTNSTFTNSGEFGLHNASPAFFAENSTCTNSGNMLLYLANMLMYDGTFNNTGKIKIENAFENAFNSSTQFTNNGSLEVQFYTPTTHHAMIILDGHFTNTPTGNVWVRGMSYGLINWGGFTNKGIFKVENASGRGIEHNSFTGKPFVNEATGQIIIDGTADIGLATYQTPGVNSGLLDIQNTTGWGIASSSAFENKTSGSILINNTQDAGLANWSAFQNYGELNIENSGKENLGLFAGEFNNWSSGQVLAKNSSWAGIINWGVAQNQGYMQIENPGHEGIRNLNWKFDNLQGGRLAISNVPPAWQAISTANGFFNTGVIALQNSPIAILTDAGTGYLNNHPCAEISMDGMVDNRHLINNEGLLKTTYSGTNSNTGTINNMGVIEDFYGSFNGVSINNQDVRVRPISGQVGGFIQNALEIGFNNSFQIGSTWYRDVNLTNPAGTYIPGVNTFTPTVGVGTHTLYFTVRDLVNNCTKTVSVQVSISSAMKGEGLTASPAITLINYPNPFAENTTIKLSLPFEAEGKLVVYDNFGRLVEVMYDGELRKDELYEFTFDASGKRVASYVATLVLSDGRTFSIRLVKAETR